MELTASSMEQELAPKEGRKEGRPLSPCTSGLALALSLSVLGSILQFKHFLLYSSTERERNLDSGRIVRNDVNPSGNLVVLNW